MAEYFVDDQLGCHVDVVAGSPTGPARGTGQTSVEPWSARPRRVQRPAASANPGRRRSGPDPAAPWESAKHCRRLTPARRERSPLPGWRPTGLPPRSARSTPRACLLTADAVVDHDGGERDATEVGQGVFVVAGRDSAPLFESVEPALDGVAVKVHAGVESWWPATC